MDQINRFLRVKPMTLRAARTYIDENHRHHKAPQGGLFAVGVETATGHDRLDAIAIVGCAIVGMPVARNAADGLTVEVTRLCTDGTPNACSFLYRCCVRVAAAIHTKTYCILDFGS